MTIAVLISVKRLVCGAPAAIDSGLLPPRVKTMATLASLNKKIAALEAQAERIANAELGKAIAKIRRIMVDSGVTIEHLAEGARSVPATVSRKLAGTKVPKAPKGKKPPKYMDPKSGATWSGLGRIPAWIANAKNRDAFLIEPPSYPEPAMAAPASKSPVKRAVSTTVAKATRGGKAKATKVAAKKAAPRKQAGSRKNESAPAQAESELTPPMKAATKARRKTAAAKKRVPTPTQDSASESSSTAS
jgi:DNA-binding protein H-NS